MLWSPSVHLPAAVTDCHDPLDMDGSIICLLISSTGVVGLDRREASGQLLYCIPSELSLLISYKLFSPVNTDCVSNSAGDSTWQRLRLGYTRRPCSSHPSWHIEMQLSLMSVKNYPDRQCRCQTSRFPSRLTQRSHDKKSDNNNNNNNNNNI
ncbi:conserved hypothetical protein [Trichinella spiralis]|uniref:hypothetical protein n=1 Tax=Trichinella spiralis TaxID=6334 RepID=UPI0001EFEE4F|nr:conserved hypothetical protein [Trichinella spiralis]